MANDTALMSANGTPIMSVHGTPLAGNNCPVRYTKCSDSSVHLWLPCSYPAAVKIGSDCYTRDCIVDETQSKTSPAYTAVTGCSDPACGGGVSCPTCLPNPVPSSVTISFSGISISDVGNCCPNNRLIQGASTFSGTYTIPQSTNPCRWELVTPYAGTTVRSPCTGVLTYQTDFLDVYLSFSVSGGIITRAIAAYIGATMTPFTANLFYASDTVSSCQSGSTGNQLSYSCGLNIGTGGTASYTL